MTMLEQLVERARDEMRMQMRSMQPLDYETLVRAILTKMREPNELMVTVMSGEPRAGLKRVCAERTWKLGIDSILDEQPKPPSPVVPLRTGHLKRVK